MVADRGLASITARFHAGAGRHEYQPGEPPAPPAEAPGPAPTHPGQLEATMAALTAEMYRSRQRLAGRARAAYPVPLPVMPYTVSAAGLLVPGAGLAGSENLGPRQGWFWDVTRVSIDGLVPIGGTSVLRKGSATSPGAGATIMSIPAASIPPGTYEVNWIVGLNGTPAAADADNFKITMTGVLAGTLSVNNGAVGEYTQDEFQITVPAGNTSALTITASGAGTAGAIYSAQISLTTTADDQVVLYKQLGTPPQSRLHTFTGGGTAPGPDWSPSHSCIMRPGDALQLAAAVPLAATQVVLSGEAIAVAAPFIGEYLL